MASERIDRYCFIKVFNYAFILILYINFVK
nr:MAG TPA: hypothetical protein [Caudoviricetes sp.]